MLEPEIRNTKRETPEDFIQLEIERARNNIRAALNKFGHSAMKAANPAPWFRRYPVHCSIISGAVLAGAAACVAVALRRKPRQEQQVDSHAAPVQVYIKKPRKAHLGLGAQLGTALIAGLTGKLSQGIKSTILSSFSHNPISTDRTQGAFVPNPTLRDVDI